MKDMSLSKFKKPSTTESCLLKRNRGWEFAANAATTRKRRRQNANAVAMASITKKDKSGFIAA